MMRLIKFLVCIAVIVAESKGLQECEEKCFAFAAGKEDALAYRRIYQVAQAIRGAQLTHATSGVVYAFDGTASDSLVGQFQGLLAAAMHILTADGGAKGACVVNFKDDKAFEVAGDSCGSTCDVAQSLLSQPFWPEDTTKADFLGGACAVANAITDCKPGSTSRGEMCGKPLASCRKRLLVAFLNSDVKREMLGTCLSFGPSVLITLSPAGEGGSVPSIPLREWGQQIDVQVDIHAISDILKCVERCPGCRLNKMGFPKYDRRSDVAFMSGADEGRVETLRNVTMGDFYTKTVGGDILNERK